LKSRKKTPLPREKKKTRADEGAIDLEEASRCSAEPQYGPKKGATVFTTKRFPEVSRKRTLLEGVRFKERGDGETKLSRRKVSGHHEPAQVNLENHFPKKVTMDKKGAENVDLIRRKPSERHSSTRCRTLLIKR